MLRFKIGVNAAHPQPGCHDAPPPPVVCHTTQCAPCAPCCPPKVALRDYIQIKGTLDRTLLEFAGWGCAPHPQHTATAPCISLSIRRRGSCGVLLVLPVSGVTPSGAVEVTWPLGFWQLGDGMYEADVVSGDASCLTIGLRVLGCNKRLLDFMNTVGVPCGNTHDGCATPIISDPCAPFIPTKKLECATC
jgi:hypothetical protein